MTTDKGMRWGNGPVTRFRVQIGMADTSVGDLDQTLAWLELRGLPDRVLLINSELCTGSLEDSGGLGLGDGEVGENRHLCLGCMNGMRCSFGYG